MRVRSRTIGHSAGNSDEENGDPRIENEKPVNRREIVGLSISRF
jgi:hypothetical protein